MPSQAMRSTGYCFHYCVPMSRGLDSSAGRTGKSIIHMLRWRHHMIAAS